MEKENIYFVYEWIRLDTNEPFYVGKGKGDRWYRRNSRNKHFLNIYNKVPTAVHILHENLSEQEALEYECWYIDEYKYNIGYNLVNLTDGGDGISGYKPSEEEIKRNRMKIHGFDIEEYKDIIIDMYINKQNSTYEIGKYFGVSDVCINRVLKKFKIELRNGGGVKNKYRGLDRYNSKCILVKDKMGNIINCFESISLCGEWIANIGLVNKPKGGKKAIKGKIDTYKNYKGLMFYSIDKDECKNIIKNNNFKDYIPQIKNII